MNNLTPGSIRNRQQLARALAGFHQRGTGVEVGVQCGDYSAQLLAAWPGHLVLVDAWRHFPAGYEADHANVGDGEHLSKMVQTARRFVRDERVSIIRGLSVPVAALFADGALDFVYLDANHSHAMVAADIAAWRPKVRAGGVLAGHDWGAREASGWGVRKAVLEHFDAAQVLVTQEEYPSWAVINRAP